MIKHQKPRTKLLVLLLLLLNCRQIFTALSKSLQASKISACVSLRYRNFHGGLVAIVVVVCGKMCGKMCGKTEKLLSDWNNNWCGCRYSPPPNYDSGLR